MHQVPGVIYMFHLRKINILLVVLAISGCGKSNEFSTLASEEKLVFGRILYSEKLYEKGDFDKAKPDILERIGNTLERKSVGGMMAICYEIIPQHHEQCSYLETYNLDPRDHGKEEDSYYAGKNLYSFRVAGTGMQLSRISVGGKFYEITNAKPISLDSGKIFYLGDTFIILHKGDVPSLIKLGIVNSNRIKSASNELAKKVNIPAGTTVKAALLDPEGIVYKTSIPVSR